VRLLAVMRLSRKKRPLVLPRVLAAAIAAGRRVRLVVAGDGAEAGALVAAARRAGVADALSVAGWQPRAVLRALHADADLFVLPTAEESFGIAALEARAAGVPVLGRAGTGLVDFVRDGIDGVLAGSDDALVAAAARLAVDDAARTRLAALGRLTPPTAFAWEAVIAEHLACYRAAGEALAHPASTGASATWPASAAVGGQRAARAGARRAGVGRAR
jgi:glycosyltransferase involved in cell wall biosynthesis